jgi:hypothetical protein
MATTTGGTTYVTSTDLVANYPTASLSLANRVDVVASGGPNSIKTSGYTITLADILGGNKFLYNSASPGTFTLPTSGLVDGMVVNVAQIGAGALTVSGGTIVGTTVTTAQYQGLQFVYASTGTTWYSVAPSVTAPGLARITPTSIANAGGSASLSGGTVTFTGVTSVSLNGCFTSTFSNYRIVFFSSTASGAVDLKARMRAAGTDDSSANYAYQFLDGSATSGTAARTTGQTSATLGSSSTTGGWVSIDVFRPQTAAPTTFSSLSAFTFAAPSVTIYSAGHNVSTSYDGITLFPGSSNFTGTVSVYGYSN